MKKFITLFLIFLCLSFNIMGVRPLAAIGTNTFKQGVYTLSDLNISPDNLYDVTNTSSQEGAYILVFDENETEMQAIRLAPGSTSFNLVPMKPGYKIVVLGDVTEVYIDPREIKKQEKLEKRSELVNYHHLCLLKFLVNRIQRLYFKYKFLESERTLFFYL